MQQKVPQNVQREDTIVGPLTLKQMIILAVGGGTAYALYITLSKTYFVEIWLPPVAIISIFTLAFAFIKIHNLPFHLYLTHLIEYHILPKKRIWIQGAGRPFISSFDQETIGKNTHTDETLHQEKTQKNLDELTKVLDNHIA